MILTAQVSIAGLLVLTSLLSMSSAQRAIYRQLNNEKLFPLVGIGLGNQPHDLIPGLIMDAAILAASDTLVSAGGDRIAHLMIDTAHSSNNEELIAQALVDAATRVNQGLDSDSDQRIIFEVDLITKVWYTHLGFDRTIFSVEESLEAMRKAFESEFVHLHVSILLHWPRCNHDIPWMRCEEEEDSLPQKVKELGTSPLSDPDNAWKDSWRALEAIYKQDHLYAIGVSNFSWQEMKTLLEFCEVVPHIYQGSLWQLMTDPYLTNKLLEKDTLYVVYGAISQIIHSHEENPDKTPNAVARLKDTSSKYNYTVVDEEAPATVISSVLAWLVQSGIAVIPRSQSHAKHNSAVFMKKFPDIEMKDQEVIASSVRGILSVKDVPLGVITHVKNSMGKAFNLFWINPSTNEEIHASDGKILEPGEALDIIAHPHHEFIIRDAENLGITKKFVVSADHGEEETFDLSEL